MGIKPEDVLPDDKNSRSFDGVKVRKGSVAAAIANVEVYTSDLSSEEEKEAAKKMLIELAPALIALGLHKHLIWKNAEIQELIEAHK